MQRRLYWASKALIQNFPICVGYMVKDQFELMLFSKSWKYTSTNTAKNTVITPDFLVWKLCGKAQFPHSFRRFAHNYAETVPFRKISTPGNQVKLRYFLQWNNKEKLSKMSIYRDDFVLYRKTARFESKPYEFHGITVRPGRHVLDVAPQIFLVHKKAHFFM